MIELCRDLAAKQPSSATRADSPRVDVLRVRPDKVAEGSLVGNLLGACDDADLVDGANFGGKAPVYAQDLTVNDGRQHEEIKDLAARLPYGGVAVLVLALFIEAVHLRDLAGLMVAAYEYDAVRVSEDTG